ARTSNRAIRWAWTGVAHLYALVHTFTAIPYLSYGQGTERQYRHPLDARQSASADDHQGLWPEWRLLARQSSEREIPVHLGWLRHHTYGVDDALAFRLRTGNRCSLHQLCTHT